MSAPIDWDRAERVALRVAARHSAPAHGSITSADFVDVTALAEDRVEATTGLRSQHGRATVHVVDRADWIRANITSLRGLLDPVMQRWAGDSHSGDSHSGAISTPRRGLDRISGSGSALLRGVSRQVTGAEVGAMLGWMSGRVLGQYDLLFADTGAHDGAVYLVGPNMLELEHRFGFAPDQFRLWVTLHELTHRAQFTGVPWMHQHFLGLVHRTLELAEPNPGRVIEACREAMRDRDAARQRLRDGGVVAMVATLEQQAVFAQTTGLMSLLEGHGDVVMDRAGTNLIPSAPRFARVLSERRRRVNPFGRMFQRLVGLEGKMNQYAAGERFIDAIEAVGGERAVDHCWRGPEHLPTMDEIRAPQLWLDRVGLAGTPAHWVA